MGILQFCIESFGETRRFLRFVATRTSISFANQLHELLFVVLADVRNHPKFQAVLLPSDQIVAVDGFAARRLVRLCLVRPDENVDEMGATPIDERGDVVTIEIVAPTSEQRKTL